MIVAWKVRVSIIRNASHYFQQNKLIYISHIYLQKLYNFKNNSTPIEK